MIRVEAVAGSKWVNQEAITIVTIVIKLTARDVKLVSTQGRTSVTCAWYLRCIFNYVFGVLAHIIKIKYCISVSVEVYARLALKLSVQLHTVRKQVFISQP